MPRTCKPYDVFKKLELGRGGRARAPAENAKEEIGAVIQAKHKRTRRKREK